MCVVEKSNPRWFGLQDGNSPFFSGGGCEAAEGRLRVGDRPVGRGWHVAHRMLCGAVVAMCETRRYVILRCLCTGGKLSWRRSARAILSGAASRVCGLEPAVPMHAHVPFASACGATKLVALAAAGSRQEGRHSAASWTGHTTVKIPGSRTCHEYSAWFHSSMAAARPKY